MLSGKTPNAERSVKKKDGSLSLDENERQLRWQEHFAEVFQAEVRMRQHDDHNTGDTAADIPVANIDFSPTAVLKAIS